MIKLIHHNFFLARTPLLPMAMFHQWQAAPDRKAFVRSMMRRPAMRDALYLASPSLHDRCQAHLARAEADEDSGNRRTPTAAQAQEETRLYNALGKYLARAAFRCTPFAMFAAITPGRIGAHTELATLDDAGMQPRIRPDSGVQAKIIKWLMSDAHLRTRLSYQSNNSLSRHGNKLYFVEGVDGERFKKYQFNQVERVRYLDSLLTLATQQTPFAQLRQHLMQETGADAATAEAYLHELIDSELLLPELAIRITGPDSFTALKQKLAEIGEAERLAAIEQALVPLQQAAGEQGRAALFEQSWQAIAGLPDCAIGRQNLLQVDCIRKVPVSLSDKLCQRLAHAATLLAQLTQRRVTHLDDFRRRFQERFGDREIALDLLFNDELGIPYPRAGKPVSDLLQGIDFPAMRKPADSELSWGAFETMLFKKFEAARACGELTLHIGAEEIRRIAAGQTEVPALHGGIHVQATLFGAGGSGPAAHDEAGIDMHIQSLGGRTGVELLGRFCDLDASLTEQVRAAIARIDQDDETRIHAEIVHLPQDRAVNIVARPILSRYEIPYLGQGGVGAAQQIPVADLLVSLRDKRFVLRSKRLQKEVIPRLTTAHHIYGNNLNLYQFLGALAYQDQPQLGFEWPVVFRSASFLPRVTIDGAIIALATWNLGAPELAALRTAHGAGLAAMQAWRAAHQLPRFVSLDVHDNVLPIDLDNAMMVQLLLEEIGNAQQVRLREAPALNTLQGQARPGQHNVEIIVPFQVAVRAAKAETVQRAGPSAPAKFPHQTVSSPPLPAAAPTAQALEPWLYIPGSAWLYFKIYCGQSQADELLSQYLAPLLRQALQAGEISHWFFLRYLDPEPHLRLRARACNRASVTALQAGLSAACARALQDGYGWKVVCDSYEPEIARYGGQMALAQCERLFHLDSEIITDFINSVPGAIPVAQRWLFAVFCVNALLDAFAMALPERRRLASDMATSFATEFRFGARQKAQLGAKYRSYRTQLDALLFGRATDAAGNPVRAAWMALLVPWQARMHEAAHQLLALQLAGQLEAPLTDILASLIHMHCNRLFTTSQRAHEAVFYDFLQRIYGSMAATGSKLPAAGD